MAAPTNGTTAYDLHKDKDFDASAIPVSAWDDLWGNFFSMRKTVVPDGRSKEDFAAFDMHIDNALALNARISTLSHSYYFAVPCTATTAGEDAFHRPIRSIMEPMFRRSSLQIGFYTGLTPGGVTIDSSWRENDGLVNTVSAMAPIGAPSVIYDPDRVIPGLWQVMPAYYGDHMSLQGGIMKYHNIRPFYLELLKMIDQLPRTCSDKEEKHIDL